MKDRFQDGFQVTLDNFLGDPVCDRWNSQRPRFSLPVALWNVDPANRLRKITPRGHSVPELIPSCHPILKSYTEDPVLKMLFIALKFLSFLYEFTEECEGLIPMHRCLFGWVFS
jgi:hypothetical protein